MSKTEGKALGKIAFYVSEYIVVILVAGIFVQVILTKQFDVNLINAVLIFQGTIMTLVWGSKASSNFAKKGE